MTEQPTTLAQCETIIRDRIGAFVEVGTALKQVRDAGLYKQAGYDTFEAYCKHRWHLSRSRVYQLITATVVVERVHNCGHQLSDVTESQVRELAKAPEAQQAQAWEKAIESAPEGVVTAEHVASVVAQLPKEDPLDDEKKAKRAKQREAIMKNPKVRAAFDLSSRIVERLESGGSNDDVAAEFGVKKKRVGEAIVAVRKVREVRIGPGRHALAAERNQKILELRDKGFSPTEVVAELGCTTREVHDAVRWAKKHGVARRENPLSSLCDYAVEFTDTWQDAMNSDDPSWTEATAEEIADLVTKLDALAFVTKRFTQTLKAQAINRRQSNEHSKLQATSAK